MKELFDIPVSLSPFEQWKSENEITLYPDLCRCFSCSDCECAPMVRAQAINRNDFALGKDDMEACFNFAKRYKIIWFQDEKVPV